MAATQAGAPVPNFGTGMILTSVIAYLAFMAFYNALYYRIDAFAFNRDSGAGAAVKVGFRKILPVLFAAILFVLAVIVGSILLIIPGLILMVSLFLYMPLIVCDNKGSISALSTSHKLVWGNWWRTLAVFMVPFFIAMIAYIAIGGVAGVVAGVAAATGAADGPAPASVNAMISVVTVVISLFIYPFSAAFMLVQLNDLKLRKRGEDLEAQLGG
jgi:hypothetical protein